MKQALVAVALGVAAVLGVTQLSTAAAGTTAATTPAKKYQLVFHVSENNPQQWNLALNNAFAFQKNQGKDNSEIEIVAIGPGLNMLKADSKVADRIAQALDRSVDIVACGETMNATKVSKADLIGGIVNRQRAGWSYIRP